MAKHDWVKNEDGSVDEWAWESGFHNGVVCRRCGEHFCVNCVPDYDEKECPKSEERKMSGYAGNKVALQSVKDHLTVKMEELEKAEKKAAAEGRNSSLIGYYHDQFMLYAGFLAQLD